MTRNLATRTTWDVRSNSSAIYRYEIYFFLSIRVFKYKVDYRYVTSTLWREDARSSRNTPRVYTPDIYPRTSRGSRDSERTFPLGLFSKTNVDERNRDRNVVRRMSSVKLYKLETRLRNGDRARAAIIYYYNYFTAWWVFPRETIYRINTQNSVRESLHFARETIFTHSLATINSNATVNMSLLSRHSRLCHYDVLSKSKTLLL